MIGGRWRLVTAFMLAIICVQLFATERVGIATLPSQRPGQVGFSLSFELAPIGRGGYRPVFLTFNSLTGTFPADRTVEVRLSPRHQLSLPHDFDFVKRITLPQGAKSVSEQVNVPVYFPWQWFRGRVYEDGRMIPFCDTGGVSLANMSIQAGNTAWCNVGVVLPNDYEDGNEPWHRIPDLRTLNTVLGSGALPTDDKKRRLDNDEALSWLNSPQQSFVQFRTLHEDEMLEQWLGYSQLDVILIAAPVWNRLEAERPAVTEAMRRWVVMGGNLWVYASSASTPSPLLASVRPIDPAQVVHYPQTLAQLRTSEQNVGPNIQQYNNFAIAAMQSRGSAGTKENVWNELTEAEHPFVRESALDTIAERLGYAELCAGRLVTISDADPFPGAAQFWQTVITVTSPPQLTWHIRNGLDVSEGTEDYWALLIAAVGRPPVTAFLVLISCFVLLVGPVAYFVLARVRRLYLLFFFAPACAAIVTTGLFAYGILADGLGTQARVRQITLVDGPTQRAAEIHRQTYFVGSTLRDGLQYDAETAVFPIHEDPFRDASSGSYGGEKESRARIRIESDTQRLTGALIPSRTQSQYLAMRPAMQLGQLRLKRDGTEATLENSLPFTFTRILARDAAGEFWLLEEPITSGSSALATSLSVDEAESWLVRNNAEVDFEIPEIYDSISSGDLFGIGSSYRYWRNSPTVPAIMKYSNLPTEGVIERRIKDYFTIREAVPHGTFIGTAETTRRMLAVEGAEMNDGVHIVMGTLP